MPTERPRTALFVETAEEVAAAVGQGLATDECTVICLTPDADYAAERAGIAYRCSDALVDEATLLAAGHRNFSLAGDIAAMLDRQLGTTPRGGTPIYTAQYHLLAIKIFIDGLLHGAVVCGSCLDAVRPSRVLFFAPAGGLAISDSGWFESAKFFGHFWPQACAGRRIEWQSLPPVAPQSGADAGSGQSRGAWARLRSAAGWLPAHLAAMAGDYLRGRTPPRIHVHRPICDHLLRRLKRSSAEVMQVDLPAVEAAATMPDLRWDDLAPVFQMGGVDTFPLAQAFLTDLATTIRRKHIGWVEGLEASFRRDAGKRAMVVVGSGPVAPSHIAAVVAARRAGVPHLTIQHGGFNGYCSFPILYLNDLFLSRHYACWGTGVEDSLRHIPGELPGEAVRAVASFHTIVSGRLADLKRRLRRRGGKSGRRRARLVYVCTGLAGPLRHFSNHLYPDLLVWRLQRTIVGLLGRHPEIDVVVKIGRTDKVRNPLGSWLAQQDWPHITIQTEGSLADLLTSTDVDVVVSDAPATTLLEALCGRAHVVALFLRSHLLLDPAAAALLRRRASLAETVPDYVTAIERALEAVAAGQQAPGDDSFLDAYGLGRGGVDALSLIHCLAKYPPVADK